MKVAELLAICKEMMRTLHGFGIKIDDYQYLELYADYIAMSKERLKVTYIVSVLASKYNICERKVYKVLRHMNRHCQIHSLR